MDGKKLCCLAALVLWAALGGAAFAAEPEQIPAPAEAATPPAGDTATAVPDGAVPGPGVEPVSPPRPYSKWTYWLPAVHRLFEHHRPKTVSVCPVNAHPDIPASYIIIKDPFGIIPRPISAPEIITLE